VLNIRDDENRAWVALKSGRRLYADLILAADGVRSRTRHKILSDVEPIFEPVIADIPFSGIMIPIPQLREDKDAPSLLSETNLTVWCGDNGFVVGRLHLKTGCRSALFWMKQTERDNSD
jgi:2-polyprenyl-6-methoxyphenol hydroxylase-like FAD-dependent oxidoreductase